MSARRPGPPRWTARLLRRLLSGPRGADVLEELEDEFASIRLRRSPRVARLWYIAQLVRPSTWMLARTLCTIERSAHDCSGLEAASRASPPRFPWLDVKLGVRMMLKHPGLALVAVFTLGVGIPAGLAPLHVAGVQEAPLPVDEAERVVALRYWDAARSRPQTPFIDDFSLWRDALSSFETVAYTSLRRGFNFVTEDGRAEPSKGAVVTSTFFDTLRVMPLLGRPLVAADDVVGAADVVVIGYGLWQSRLGGDPDVVGRIVRVGGAPRTIVGVMPEGFGLPNRDELWLPLEGNVGDGGVVRGGTPDPLVIGRLRDGVTPEEAEAEFAGVRQRFLDRFSEDYGRLRAEVVPFATGFHGYPRLGAMSDPRFFLLQTLAVLLLLVVCANVGMLIFTRTASRAAELSVRTVLGASRMRILSQLFVESLVLSVLAAGVGLLGASLLASKLLERFLQTQPDWIDYGLTPETALRALVLVVLSAAVVGTIPALKVTGGRVQSSIQSAGPARRRLRFGGVSSVLVVANVALAVATVGVGTLLASRLRDTAVGAERRALPEEFLSAKLTIPSALIPDLPGVPFDLDDYTRRAVALRSELTARIESHPEIRGLAVSDVVPGEDHPTGSIEVDAMPEGDGADPRRVRTARVLPHYFDALGVEPLVGRTFDENDVGTDSPVAIVTATFADRMLSGRYAIGQRIRYKNGRGEPTGPWHEIVGVVDDLDGMDGMPAESDQGFSGTNGVVYHPMAGPERTFAVTVHVGSDPASFTPQLRSIVAGVDPSVIISEPRALHEVVAQSQVRTRALVQGTAVLVVILVTLAVSGIYALMSFSVTERRKEIGVRAALGAGRGRIVRTVARRSLAQLGGGVALGALLAWPILRQLGSSGGLTRSPLTVALGVAATLMVLIGALACTGPTLRALRVLPAEVLQESG